MDEKYIWPLIGVALGWALSLFSSVLRDRAERRQKLGVLISKLLHVHSQMLTLKKVSEIFKNDASNWQEYEPLRKRLTQRHFLEPASHLDSLREAIDDVSGFYPVEARSLHSLVDMLLKNKNTSLAEASESQDLYVRMLSAYEATLWAAEKILLVNIRRFSLRHGLYTYATVLSEFRRRKQPSYKKNIEFVENFSAETLGATRELRRQKSSSNETASSLKLKVGESPP